MLSFQSLSSFLHHDIWYNLLMEKNTKLTEEQLNQIPKDVLVNMYLQLSANQQQVMQQNDQLLRQVTSPG